MRTICDTCARPQPSDWRDGDLCIWCGQAIRREVRCFWCANWTPAVKFCRTCGAATVDSALYGAARMLKDAGCDRFTIPRQLAELEAGQVENFTRLYQEHAAIAAHHVEQVEFLERYLEQKHWSGALEQSLAAELPWPAERLEAMRSAAKKDLVRAAPLARARAIGETSPFPRTRVLATIARLSLEDWSALDETASLVSSAEDGIRTEAVLAAAHWRVLYGCGLVVSRRRQIIEELLRCPLREAAAIRLALLGETVEGPVTGNDDFATALVKGDVDTLTAAARETGDSQRRFAAAQKLIALEVLAPVAVVLAAGSEEQQIALMQLLDRRKKPVLELREALFRLARDNGSERVRQLACFLLCNGCREDEALPIAEAGRGDPRVYQALLQRAALPPAALEEFGAYLLRRGSFTMSQYGLADAAKPGRMPTDFVPKYWRDATPETRLELCKFAEAQLGGCEDLALHRFLVQVAFQGGADVKVQSQAWSCLYRWYDSFGYPRRRPLRISEESIREFFSSPATFLNRFAGLLDGRAILHESIHRDAIAEILRYPDPSARPAIEEAPRETATLVAALAGVMSDKTVDFTIRLACTDFLGFLGVERTLRAFLGTDLDLQSKRALGID